MALSSKDKTPKSSGWGFDFHVTHPQRQVRTIAGDLLVPASADDIPPVPEEHVASVERALALIADLLSDRDHQNFLCENRVSKEAADREALALNRIIGSGMLRSVLRMETAAAERASANRSWVMGHHWTKKDLASVLRTEVVSARELVPGDVVIGDSGPWQVARVERLPSDYVDVIDEARNDAAEMPSGMKMPGGVEVQIVLRSALRSR